MSSITIYEDDFLVDSVDALAALGNRITLYLSTGARVGTVFADTTWGAAELYGTGDGRTARKVGSTVVITVPAGTIAAGSTITHYGVMSGSKLYRRVGLQPVDLTINRGDMAFDVRVTPGLDFNPNEAAA